MINPFEGLECHAVNTDNGFAMLADTIVRNFEMAVDERVEDMEYETLEALEDEGQALRIRVQFAIDDAYCWGAAALGGMVGMAEAIKERARSFPNE